MENVRVKMYSISEPLKKIWPENKIVYTIECYSSGRTWQDSVISLGLFSHMSHREYADIMKEKFDCEEYCLRIFYRTKKDCEEAIKFLESITIMNKLL